MNILWPLPYTVHAHNCPEVFSVITGLECASRSYNNFRSTLGPFSRFLFLLFLQFSMVYLCSSKHLEAGQEYVRNVKGHRPGFGDFFFLFIHAYFEVSAFSDLRLFKGDDFCVAWIFSSCIFLYYYWETDNKVPVVAFSPQSCFVSFLKLYNLCK